jgi:hypothetical protein
MEAERSSRIDELKSEISMLKKDELRLGWIVTSEFITVELRMRTLKHLDSVQKNLREAETELSRLENDA